MINYVEISVIPVENLKKDILRTLLYYDIFGHPLTEDEIFSFLARNSISKEVFVKHLRELSESESSPFARRDGYYYVKPAADSINRRLEKESYSKKMWRSASFVTHIIKRFPFVRAVMVSGSLSKNSSDKKSDLDFLVITANNRLWISRTLLMLFKKIFLLNSYKFFCINYFITESNLEIEDKNIFTATEIATIKIIYNSDLLNKFIEQNKWITDYFPNYMLCDPMLHSPGCRVNNRRSIFQKLLELPYSGFIGNSLNNWLMKFTARHWEKKYAHLNESERNHMFRTKPDVSKTHPGNMQKRILAMYNEKLKEFNL